MKKSIEKVLFIFCICLCIFGQFISYHCFAEINSQTNTDLNYKTLLDGDLNVWKLKFNELKKKLKDQYKGVDAGSMGGDDSDFLFIPGETSNQNLVVFNSGIHGVEAPAGVVFQHIFLNEFSSFDRSKTAILIFHVMNSYGAKNGRRFNKNNIDLNRNFYDFEVIQKNGFPGKKILNIEYKQLETFFESKASQFGVIWNSLTEGKLKIIKALRGQYHSPHGLFFGGDQIESENQIAQNLLIRYLEGTKNVLIIDVHTGLGAFGINQIMVNPVSLLSNIETKKAYQNEIDLLNKMFPSEECADLCEILAEPVLSKNKPENHSDSIHQFKTTGDFTQWIYERYPKLRLQGMILSITAEIGTTSGLNVLQGLINENYCFWHKENCGTDEILENTNHLRELFNPKSQKWQSQVIKAGHQMNNAIARFAKI